MAKQVFKASELPHVFASRNVKKGRVASGFQEFEGDAYTIDRNTRARFIDSKILKPVGVDKLGKPKRQVLLHVLQNTCGGPFPGAMLDLIIAMPDTFELIELQGQGAVDEELGIVVANELNWLADNIGNNPTKQLKYIPRLIAGVASADARKRFRKRFTQLKRLYDTIYSVARYRYSAVIGVYEAVRLLREDSRFVTIIVEAATQGRHLPFPKAVKELDEAVLAQAHAEWKEAIDGKRRLIESDRVSYYQHSHTLSTPFAPPEDLLGLAPKYTEQVVSLEKQRIELLEAKQAELHPRIATLAQEERELNAQTTALDKELTEAKLDTEEEIEAQALRLGQVAQIDKTKRNLSEERGKLRAYGLEPELVDDVCWTADTHSLSNKLEVAKFWLDPTIPERIRIVEAFGDFDRYSFNPTPEQIELIKPLIVMGELDITRQVVQSEDARMPLLKKANELIRAELHRDRVRIQQERRERVLTAWRAGQCADPKDLPIDIDESERELMRAAWRRRENVHPHGPIMLRRIDESIRTSQGAEVPFGVAPHLYALCVECRSTQTQYDVSEDVGIYQLRRINTDGSLIVGCHTIPWDEIELFASQHLQETSNVT
jgi:hypothetical protein